MGRPVGCTEVEISQVKEVVRLSKKDLSRPDIAEEAGVSQFTVWKYQRAFDLI